jgi:LemA protein
MKKYVPFVVIGVILLVVIGWLVNVYNSFVVLNEDVTTQWAQVENQYQRRYDLIPNLVKTVEGIAKQEQAVFLGVAEARSKVGQIQITPEMLSNPKAFEAFQNAQDGLSSALSRLLVAVEAYPELKSNENFLALQTQLEGTENRIAVERTRFNDVVKVYNIKAKGIPGAWFVRLFGFDSEKVLFKAEAGAEKAPEVNFDLK